MSLPCSDENVLNSPWVWTACYIQNNSFWVYIQSSDPHQIVTLSEYIHEAQGIPEMGLNTVCHLIPSVLLDR
jgi:hypothetical protein